MKYLFVVWFLFVAHVAQSMEVGFYNPEGVDARFESSIDFAMIEVISEKQVLEAMQEAQTMGLGLTLNIGPSITRSRSASELNTTYLNTQGEKVQKLFVPKYHNKIKKFVTDEEIKIVLERLALAMQKFPQTIDTVFLVDEPYLKGISRREISRVADLAKGFLSAEGHKEIKIGIVFASLTYDPEFAQELDRRATEYVKAADAKRLEIENLGAFSRLARWIAGKDDWIANFTERRLITYDQAGNIYKGGGIPSNLDVVGFDFYLATLLLDDLYKNSLGWMYEKYQLPECEPFADRKIIAVRRHLSFFGASETQFEGLVSDRELLDAVFDCRTGTIAKALGAYLGEGDPEIIMIGESSSNGLMNFGYNRSMKKSQDWSLVENRVRNEVERYLTRDIVRDIPNLSRIAFFTYGNPTDHSIGQTIRGAKEMPTVFEAIKQYHRSEVPYTN